MKEIYLEIGEIAVINGIKVQCVDASPMQVVDIICQHCAFRSHYPKEDAKCISVLCMNFHGKGRRDGNNVYFKEI